MDAAPTMPESSTSAATTYSRKNCNCTRRSAETVVRCELASASGNVAKSNSGLRLASTSYAGSVGSSIGFPSPCWSPLTESSGPERVDGVRRGRPGGMALKRWIERRGSCSPCDAVVVEISNRVVAEPLIAPGHDRCREPALTGD